MFKVLEGIKVETPPTEGVVTGEIPPWVNGSLFRNGPAMYQIGDQKYLHVFDGMAAIQKFEVRNGTAVYSRKFIKSETYKKNMAANRIIVSEFGTMAQYPDPCKNVFQRFFSYFFPGDLTDNTVVSVWPLRDRLYASTESNFVHEIDPDNLDTLNRVDLRDCMTINSATAHVHWDKDGTIHNIGYSYKGHPSYCIFRVPASSGNLRDGKIVCSVKARWPWNPGYIHSFAVTDNYYVFIEQPVAFNLWKLMTCNIRGLTAANCIDFWPDEKAIFHVINKSDGTEVNSEFVYQSDAFFTFHHCNAYEDGDNLVLDICAYENDLIIKKLYLKEYSEENIMERMPTSTLSRYVLPLAIENKTPQNKNLIHLEDCKAEAVKVSDTAVHCTAEIIYDQGFDLPTINYALYNGKKYRYVYGTTILLTRDTGRLVKIDVVKKTSISWSIPGYLPSEPVFVPDPDGKEEDDGVVLSAVNSTFDGKYAFLLVLDGNTFEERARVEFPDIEFNTDFHGFFKKCAET